MAVDGLHHATILDDNNVALQMKDVDEVLIHDAYVFEYGFSSSCYPCK